MHSIISVLTLAATVCSDPRPGPRSGHALAYYSKRHVVAMFGGASNAGLATSLWTWDGTEWRCLADAGPPGRLDAELVYDAKRDRLVLFGGRVRSGREQRLLNDTWEWDGHTWSEVAKTGPAPAPRVHMGVAFDPSTNATIVHSGTAANEEFADTWSWNGDRWTRIASLDHRAIVNSMVTLRDGRVMLVTATPDADASKNDLLRVGLLRLEGTRWVEISRDGPAFSPRAATAPSGEGLLLYAGWEPNGTAVTRRWNGAAWSEIQHSPPRRRGAQMAYDARRNVVVMIGGETADGNTSEIWEWSERTGWRLVAK